jgi:hypothetical protein
MVRNEARPRDRSNSCNKTMFECRKKQIGALKGWRGIQEEECRTLNIPRIITYYLDRRAGKSECQPPKVHDHVTELHSQIQLPNKEAFGVCW